MPCVFRPDMLNHPALDSPSGRRGPDHDPCDHSPRSPWVTDKIRQAARLSVAPMMDGSDAF